MKVALVYDRVTKWGGAERVLLALKKIFPEAPLFTAVYDKKRATWANVFTVYTSFLKYIPFSQKHEILPFFMPLAFESFNFDEYDLVISVTSESAKGIITHPKTRHICICLTPTRYLWSSYDEYFSNTIFRFLAKPIVMYLRAWDMIAAKRPDSYIAISEEVKRRITQYYHQDSEVIYPPLMLDTIEKRVKKQAQQEAYFLVVSRLSRFTEYKRVDIAIDAANSLKLPLKIVGGGDIAYFKKKAGPTVEFVGSVTDEKLCQYYANCKALIFPGKEDFGLVMAEAQYFGKPVIAYKAGGALEIVKEGETGVFFDEQNAQALIKVLEKFNERSYNSEACRKNAEKFAFKEFKSKLKLYIDRKKI